MRNKGFNMIYLSVKNRRLLCIVLVLAMLLSNFSLIVTSLDIADKSVVVSDNIRISGDVDRNGIVDDNDLVLLSKHVAKISQINDTNLLVNADVNSDGEINAGDLTELSSMLNSDSDFRIVDTAVSQNTAIVGSDFEWSVSSAGGEGQVEYSFELRKLSNQPENIDKSSNLVIASQDYSTEDVFKVKINEAGKYAVTVYCQDESGTICELNNILPVTVTNTKFDSIAITSDKIEYACVNDSIVWSVDTIGGNAPFTYEYTLYHNNRKVETIISQSPTYCLDSCSLGEYRLFVECTDVEGLCNIEYSEMVSVYTEAECYPYAPRLRVEENSVALSDTMDNAAKNEPHPITLIWDYVPNAKEYGMELSYHSSGQWITAHVADSISNNRYTIPYSIFKSSLYERLYRIGVYSKGVAEGTVDYYYFYMMPQKVATNLVIDDGQTSNWDIAAAKMVSRHFDVSSELDYSVSSDVDWITCVKGADGFIATVSENSSHVDSRTGTITVDNGENTASIKVTQGDGQGAPKLLYPYLSSDPENPTQRPYGGITLGFEEYEANYVGIKIYELTSKGETVAYENIVPRKTDFLHIPCGGNGYVFSAGKTYIVELAGRYSTAYAENEMECDVEKARFYIDMVSDGHEILVNGTDHYKASDFQEVTIDLFSTNTWTCSTNADWIHVEDYDRIAFRRDIEIVEITLDPNYTEETRVGFVTFFCGDKKAIVEISQKSWLPRYEYPNISKDMNNPTVLPSKGLITNTICQKESYSTYSNGIWSDEEEWASGFSERTVLIPDDFFKPDVLYRFTLCTGDYTNIYYAKFSETLSQNYIIFNENGFDVTNIAKNVASEQSSFEIRMKSNCVWSISSNASWLAPSVTNGNVQTSLKNISINVDTNNTGKERIGVLSFKAGSTVCATITVTQPATDYLELLTIAKDTMSDYIRYNSETSFRNCDGTGDSLKLYAWTNTTWGATSNSSWITISGKSTISDVKSGKSISIKLKENTTDSLRTGSLTVYSGKVKKTITITQVPGMKALTLVSPTLSTSYKSPSVLLYNDLNLVWNAIEGAVKYEIEVTPHDPNLYIDSWGRSFKYDIIANNSNTTYSCTIPKHAFSLNGDSYDYIKITAYDKYGYYVCDFYYLISTLNDAARINGTTTPIWENATDIEVSQDFVVNSTSNWSAKSQSSWIAIDRTSGSNGDTLKVSLSKNNGSARTGQVVITVGGTKTVLTVNQCAYLMEYPTFAQSMFSDDPGNPTIVDAGTSSIRVLWNYEPQAQGYQLKLGMFKSDNVETVIDRVNCDNTSEYTFNNLALIPGIRYSFTLIRNSHWGATATKCYFMINDENAYVQVNKESNVEKELDADEDSTYVTITSSGMWTAVVSDDWLIVDNEPITQADLDNDDYTTADFASYSGNSGDKLYISVLANPSNTYRYGTITVKSSGAEATISIAQEPYYETAKIYSPMLAEHRQDSVGLPYGNVTVRWNSCVGGAGTYQIYLEERQEDSTYRYYDIFEDTNVKKNSYTIPVSELKEGGYYCLTLCSDLVGIDKDDSPCQKYYFYMKYENELTVSADVNWNLDDKQVEISASATGGAGGYLYSYELLCNGESLNRSDLWDWEYYTFPLSETGNYQVRVYCCDESGASDEFYSTAYESDDSLADLVTLSQSKLLLGTMGENAAVTINSNAAWTIESYPSWITCSALEGNNGDSTTVSVKANTSTERTGTVVFVSGSARASLSVTQESAVLKTVITYPLNGTTIDLGDIPISWKQISEADSYLVSIRDITTDVLLTQHSPVTNNKYTIPAISLANGHDYRIAVGAVVGNQTWWTESTFEVSVLEIGNDSLEEDEIITHDYIRITVGTSLINQNYTHHDVITTYYEKCSICGDTTAQKTDTVTVAHNFTYSGHESAHPHAKFQRCSCGAAPYIEGAFKTANGQVQDENLCCICRGHSYDNADPKEVNGQWRVYCTKCGNYKSVNAPSANNPIVCTHPNGFNMKRTVTTAKSYNNINEKYSHLAYNSSYTVYCCSQCGTADMSTKSTSLSNQYEPHSFGNDAICVSCGYVSSKGIYDCTNPYKLKIDSKYYFDGGYIFTGIGESLIIQVYDQADGTCYLASSLPNVSLTLKDADGIGKIENNKFIATNSGTCEVVLSYYGKQLDSITIGVSVLSVEDKWHSYNILSSGTVRIDDLNDIDWSDGNALITPWAAMGKYSSKQNSDGSHTISFEVYNSSAEVLGWGIYDNSGNRVNNKAVLIEPYWGTGSPFGDAWRTFSKTAQIWDWSKSFDGSGTTTQKITLTVPEGGYVQLLNAQDDFFVLCANLAEVIRGVMGLKDDIEGLMDPKAAKDVRAAIDSFENGEFAEVIWEYYLNDTFGKTLPEVIESIFDNYTEDIALAVLTETLLKEGLLKYIAEEAPGAIGLAILDKLEDGLLWRVPGVGNMMYFVKHGCQTLYDGLGTSQLIKAFVRYYNGDEEVYISAILTPHRNYSDTAVNNLMLLNDDSNMADTQLYLTMSTSRTVDTQNFYYDLSDISFEGTNDSTNATDIMLYSASPTYLTAGDSNMMATVPVKAKVGDTITVILSNESMTVSSFTCGIQYDQENLSIVSIKGTDVNNPEKISIKQTTNNSEWKTLVYSSLEEANASGRIGFAFVNSTDVSCKEGVFAEITFKAIAPGTASFVLYEDSYGIDGYKSDTVDIETCDINEANAGTIGDSNGDGNVDVKDAVLLAQHLAGWNVSVNSQKSDCNADGKVDVKDAVLLAQYLAGWSVKLG